MRIINLVENTEGGAHCGCEHGLSFYIETAEHKLLMDTGASDLVLKNAQALGVDLSKVDTVILSHGHYDHGGGILPFAGINPNAKIYIQSSAIGEYVSTSSGKERYIGMPAQVKDLPQVVLVGPGIGESAEFDPGFLKIDEELSLFWKIGHEHPIPEGNKALLFKNSDGTVQDDFRHEQCLVIRQSGRSFLLSGCAHHGILNILDRYFELYRKNPDVVISGFHMMRKNGYSEADIEIIINTALALKKYDTQFYTCHCTGTEPYEAMYKIMGDQLKYVHCGDEVFFWRDGKGAGEVLPFEFKVEEAAAEKDDTAVTPENLKKEKSSPASKAETALKRKNNSLKYRAALVCAGAAFLAVAVVTGRYKD